MKFKMNMKKIKGGPGSVLMFALIFGVAIFTLTKLTEYTRTTRSLTYSEFLRDVEADKVKKVHIVGQEAFGTYKDGSRFDAVIADSAQNWEILKNHGVEFSTSLPNATFSFWYLILLMIVAGIIALIVMIVRQSRSQGGNGNIFSMGKSKAKMILQLRLRLNLMMWRALRKQKRICVILLISLKILKIPSFRRTAPTWRFACW